MPNDLSARAEPSTLPAVEAARLRAGLLLGDAAAWVSRLLGKGSGASIRGQVLTRVQPRAFAALVQGRRIVAVTGTNGKTTTSHLVAAAVRRGLGSDAERRLVTNADGANLHYGIASALAKARRADLAVLETDERVVADLLEHGRPEVLVLLNFSRDQLDRNHEIAFLGRAWRQALARAGAQGPLVIANSDDPLIVWAAQTARKVVWVDTASTWTADAALCPHCGSLLRRVNPTPDSTGSWDCPGCDLTEPAADYVVRGDAVTLPDGDTVPLVLNVPGRFNVANAAMALAAVREVGVGVEDALAGFAEVRSPAGRFAVASFGDTSARLVLSKNPAGWAESLPLLRTDTVVLAIDSVAADGKDVSWLWDVDFEQLRGKHVVCTGPRAYDLAVRLEYAEVDHEVIPDLDAALRAVSGAEQPVDLIATYTPFQKLLKRAGLR